MAVWKFLPGLRLFLARAGHNRLHACRQSRQTWPELWHNVQMFQ
jgi:hypothetical protein